MTPFATAILLSILSTQAIWTKRNYIKWFLGFASCLTLFYFLTPLHINKKTIPILCMPLYWLFLCFFCDRIFQKFFTKNKEEALTHKNVHNDCLVFVTINSSGLGTTYDEKLRKPKTIDFAFSAIVYVGHFLFTYLVWVICEIFKT